MATITVPRKVCDRCGKTFRKDDEVFSLRSESKRVIPAAEGIDDTNLLTLEEVCGTCRKTYDSNVDRYLKMKNTRTKGRNLHLMTVEHETEDAGDSE